MFRRAECRVQGFGVRAQDFGVVVMPETLNPEPDLNSLSFAELQGNRIHKSPALSLCPAAKTPKGFRVLGFPVVGFGVHGLRAVYHHNLWVVSRYRHAPIHCRLSRRKADFVKRALRTSTMQAMNIPNG